MNAIITTTIRPPTNALRRFAAMPGWTLYVVADQATPSAAFDELPCVYVDCGMQRDRWPELSARIGWNRAERRVIGFLAALADGASVLASVDDDVVPHSHWGRDLLVGREVDLDVWSSRSGVLDPYAVCLRGSVWHRGYPINRLPDRTCDHAGTQAVFVDFQVDICDGVLDVDACYRLEHGDQASDVPRFAPFSSLQPAPFSTQCTFFTAPAARAYMMPIGVGRVHDIWASWAVQAQGFRVAFCPPSATHERPPHNTTAEWLDELQTYGRASDAVTLTHKWHAEDASAYRRCLPC